MANDRIYITCKYCGAEKLLAKYYPTINANEWPASDFADWMYTHMHCETHPRGFDLAGEPGFTLKTESEGNADVRTLNS